MMNQRIPLRGRFGAKTRGPRSRVAPKAFNHGSPRDGVGLRGNRRANL